MPYVRCEVAVNKELLTHHCVTKVVWPTNAMLITLIPPLIATSVWLLAVMLQRSCRNKTL